MLPVLRWHVYYSLWRTLSVFSLTEGEARVEQLQPQQHLVRRVGLRGRVLLRLLFLIGLLLVGPLLLRGRGRDALALLVGAACVQLAQLLLELDLRVLEPPVGEPPAPEALAERRLGQRLGVLQQQLAERARILTSRQEFGPPSATLVGAGSN